MPAAMHEIAPAPGDRLMSQEAAKKASQVESDIDRSRKQRRFYGNDGLRLIYIFLTIATS